VPAGDYWPVPEYAAAVLGPRGGGTVRARINTSGGLFMVCAWAVHELGVGVVVLLTIHIHTGSWLSAASLCCRECTKRHNRGAQFMCLWVQAQLQLQ
jgi:hypothetical protein